MSHSSTGLPRIPEPPADWNPNYMREVIRSLTTWMNAIREPDDTEMGFTAIETVTTDTVMGAQDGIVLANAATAGLTVTLPAPNLVMGRRFVVKKIDTSANIVGVVASSQIDRRGGWFLTVPYQSVMVESNGVEYWVIATVAGGTSIVSMPTTGSLRITGWIA